MTFIKLLTGLNFLFKKDDYILTKYRQLMSCSWKTVGGQPYAGMAGIEVVEMVKSGKRLPKPPHIYSKL